jgi:hypothetical protein
MTARQEGDGVMWGMEMSIIKWVRQQEKKQRGKEQVKTEKGD